MNQLERITYMEKKLDEVREVIGDFSSAFEKFASIQAQVKELEEYYTSPQWRRDFEDDESGKLPEDLKRGVLSEDGIYNTLCENRELLRRLKDSGEK